VLWHCWLGVRKSIRPVQTDWWSVGVVICLEWRADCLHMVQLMSLHPKTPSSLTWYKPRLVLPFWYRLTQDVLEKRPLNRCSSSCSSSSSCCCWGKGVGGKGNFAGGPPCCKVQHCGRVSPRLGLLLYCSHRFTTHSPTKAVYSSHNNWLFIIISSLSLQR